MSRHLYAPAPPALDGDPPLHTSVIRYKHPVGFTPRTDLEAIGAWLRLLDMTGHLARLSGAELRVLCALAVRTNGQKFQERSIMFSWPGEVLLATKAGVRGGSVYRVTRDLVSIGLLKRGTETIDGNEQDGWVVVSPDEVPAPDEAEPVRTFRKKKVRTFRGIEGRKYARATGGARKDDPPRAPSAARSARHGQRAQTAENTIDNACASARAEESETLKSSSSNDSPTTDGVRRAAAAALKAVGIGERKAAKLAALETTTPVVIRAAIVEYRKKPPTERKTGLIVWLVENPDEISPLATTQAIAELEATERAAARVAGIIAPPPPPAPRADPKVAAEGVKQLREALARAKAEAP